MFDGIDKASPIPGTPGAGSSQPRVDRLWPGEGLPWVGEFRKSAKGLDSLLAWASGQGASRVAFQTSHPVWIRVHGINYRATRRDVDEVDLSDIVNHLYGADGMAKLQGGHDFDARYTIPVDRLTKLQFRVNGSSTRTTRRDGCNVVIRPIVDLPPSLAEQRVEPGILEAYAPREGFVIVGGSTGSGKSTLIGGFTLAKLMHPSRNFNIASAEAPVEFLLEGIRGSRSTINQHDVPRDYPTFEAFARGCMRREMTDLTVGECRDDVTAVASADLAITGHAVTTTTHAATARETAHRLAGLLPASQRDNYTVVMAQTLKLIVNQRLVPSTDGKRTALREFIVFDKPLRRKFGSEGSAAWPDLIDQAIDGQGQSFATAIRRALDEGRISEEIAREEMARDV